MSAIDYMASSCKSALNRVSGMPFRWSLNPYRGCVHGCHYCYARATHAYLGFDAGADFSTKIVVKTNMPEVLRRELARPAWQRERVAIGTATDAYQPCEGRYRLTRRCLEAFRDHETPVSIVTKSTLIVRDLDLLAELARGPGATVFFTITTLDDALWRVIEPGTPPPRKRLDVLQRLSAAGVETGVFLAPILPGITDSAAAIEAVAVAARAHGATMFGSSALRLAPLVREHFLSVIAERFPELLPRYERAFVGTNVAPAYQIAIEARVGQIRERAGFAVDAMRGRETRASHAPELVGFATRRAGQLSLPLLDATSFSEPR
jgi:DNA repair photolyase